MVNRSVWTPLFRSHLERREPNLGPYSGGHCPADHPSAEGVHHDCQIQESSLRRNIGNVSNPEVVGTIRRKIAVHEVWNRPGSISSQCRSRPFSSAYAAKASFFQEAGNPLWAYADAGGMQSGMNARPAVGTSRFGMNLSDSTSKHHVLSGSFGRRSAPPGVVAASQNSEYTTHGGDREFGLVRIYESEEFGGKSPFSRANQAVAFARISRSCCSWRSFLRSSRISSFSSEVGPSDRMPSSRSVCFNQLRIVCSVGSNFSASSLGEPAASSHIDDSISKLFWVWWTCSWHGWSRLVDESERTST